MTVLEYGEDIMVVDMGSVFPREDMPGVDLVIPDVTYLTKNAARCAPLSSPTATRTISEQRPISCATCPARYTAPV